MNYQPQSFEAPDGTPMVIVTEKEFRRLQALAAEQQDIVDAKTELAAIDDGAGIVPDEVMTLLIEGMSPIAAWRLFRGLSQAQLADRLGVSQVRVSRLEMGYQSLSTALAARIAAALDAPSWAFDAETWTPLSPRQRARQAKVRLLVSANPKRPGSKAHDRFKGYFTLDWSKPITVQDCLDAGLRTDDIAWDKRHGFIDVA